MHPFSHSCLSLSLFLGVFVCVEHHPIKYAIDGTNRWWQSPSIKNGMDYHYVTITLDLKQVDRHTQTKLEDTVLTYACIPLPQS